jgi:ribokinase
MIVVFGSINLDLIFPLPHLPVAGETVLCPAASVEPGGKGANQAVAAARDGARVVMVGAVGDDALAAGALGLLRDAGVDLSRVGRVDAGTGCAAVLVDRAGANAIAVGSGANRRVRADQVEDALLAPDTTLLLQMEVPAEETARLIRRARGRVGRIILNLAPAAGLPADALAGVDILVVNETEAAWLAAQHACAADAGGLHAAFGVTVIRTLGADGLEAATPDGLRHLPARAITAVDTTAAGDCFVGVLAAALDRGGTLPDALARAGAAAALCCTRAGSQGSVPWAAETDVFL